MRKVAIFTAKVTETVAVKRQLTTKPLRTHTADNGVAYNVWGLREKLSSDRPAPNLEIALVQTGRGQHKVMTTPTAVVQDFKPDFSLFLGCAGGEPDETCEGDVFVAENVWNYEIGKLMRRKFVFKAHPKAPTAQLLTAARATSEKGVWRKRNPEADRTKRDVLFGDSASGNKVINSEDATLWKQIKEGERDGIISAETEGYNFFEAMDEIRHHYLMIRGISDHLSNKNTEGAKRDDNRQTMATNRAAAFAAQLILDFEYEKLRGLHGGSRKTRKAESPYCGFWRSTWTFRNEKCEDLINIDDVDEGSGNVSGRRVFVSRKVQLPYRITGAVHQDRIHLIGIPLFEDRPYSVTLVLKPSDHYYTGLTGIAVRPLSADAPVDAAAENQLWHERDFWAAITKYKKVKDPKADSPKLWAAFEALAKKR